MSKGIIVVVECISSAVNYIQDIIDEGYEPVLLEPRPKWYMRWYMRHFHDHELSDMRGKDAPRPRIMMAKKTYAETLAQMKALSPVLIIPGSDAGIELAANLSHDLGLTGNDPANLPKMRDKYLCQQALKAAGIRSIESVMASSLEETLAFFEKMQAKGKGVVVKPTSGISSIGVYVCHTADEVKHAYQSNRANPLYKNYAGGTEKVLVQECIEGTEYVVNSVSCGDELRITGFYVYSRRVIPNKGKTYDYQISLAADDPMIASLAAYQIAVVKALGITHGAVHSEVMVDEDGPVLIEANCRLCGFKMRSSVLEEATGVSESRLSLRSYLYPDSLADELREILCTNKKFLLGKHLTLYKGRYIRELTVEKALRDIPGFRYVMAEKTKGYFPATINLSTELAGAVFVCRSREEAMQVVDAVNDMEINHPEKLFH